MVRSFGQFPSFIFGSFLGASGSLWEPPGASGSFWELLGDSGSLLGVSGELLGTPLGTSWEPLGVFGSFWETPGSFWETLSASGSFWSFWELPETSGSPDAPLARMETGSDTHLLYQELMNFGCSIYKRNLSNSLLPDSPDGAPPRQTRKLSKEPFFITRPTFARKQLQYTNRCTRIGK